MGRKKKFGNASKTKTIRIPSELVSQVEDFAERISGESLECTDENGQVIIYDQDGFTKTKAPELQDSPLVLEQEGSGEGFRDESEIVDLIFASAPQVYERRSESSQIIVQAHSTDQESGVGLAKEDDEGHVWKNLAEIQAGLKAIAEGVQNAEEYNRLTWDFLQELKQGELAPESNIKSSDEPIEEVVREVTAEIEGVKETSVQEELPDDEIDEEAVFDEVENEVDDEDELEDTTTCIIASEFLEFDSEPTVEEAVEQTLKEPSAEDTQVEAALLAEAVPIQIEESQLALLLEGSEAELVDEIAQVGEVASEPGIKVQLVASILEPFESETQEPVVIKASEVKEETAELELAQRLDPEVEEEVKVESPPVVEPSISHLVELENRQVPVVETVPIEAVRDQGSVIFPIQVPAQHSEVSTLGQEAKDFAQTVFAAWKKLSTQGTGDTWGIEIPIAKIYESEFRYLLAVSFLGKLDRIRDVEVVWGCKVRFVSGGTSTHTVGKGQYSALTFDRPGSSASSIGLLKRETKPIQPLVISMPTDDLKLPPFSTGDHVSKKQAEEIAELLGSKGQGELQSRSVAKAERPNLKSIRDSLLSRIRKVLGKYSKSDV